MSTRIHELLSVIEQGKSAKADLQALLQTRAEEIFQDFLDTLSSGDWGDFKSPCQYGLNDVTIRKGEVSFTVVETNRDAENNLCHRERSYEGWYTFRFTLALDGLLHVRVTEADGQCSSYPGPHAFFQAFSTGTGRSVSYYAHGRRLDYKWEGHRQSSYYVPWSYGPLMISPQPEITPVSEEISSPEADAS
jgi:hypothetical protein